MILDADRKSEDTKKTIFDAGRNSDNIKICILMLAEGRTKRKKEF